MKIRALFTFTIVLCLILFSYLNISHAAMYNFTFENDGDLTNPPFGTLVVTNTIANRLDFVVTADTTKLGTGADIEEFGFNINFSDPLTLIGAAWKTGGGPTAKKVKGRNSIFDYVVDFGQGTPTINPASFGITGSGLDLTALTSVALSTQSEKPDAHFMMHVQSTSTISGSEAVGGLYNSVPIPSSILLLGTGLVGLVGRRFRKKSMK